VRERRGRETWNINSMVPCFLFSFFRSRSVCWRVFTYRSIRNKITKLKPKKKQNEVNAYGMIKQERKIIRFEEDRWWAVLWSPHRLPTARWSKRLTYFLGKFVERGLIFPGKCVEALREKGRSTSTGREGERLSQILAVANKFTHADGAMPLWVVGWMFRSRKY
jgi:hypothetical protein